jgi:hypothetical protein
MCSDCQVPLVAELPGSAVPADASYENESFVLIWSGMDPQKHKEVGALLENEKIPTRTILRDDHLVSPSMQPAFKVHVPMSLARKATELLKDDPLLADDDNASIDDPEIGELPAEEYNPDESDLRAPRADWHPDDATAEIWSGDTEEVAEMVAACLRENQIDSRRNDDREDDEDSENPPPKIEGYKLFVLPEDEARARQIVREIVDGTPE